MKEIFPDVSLGAINCSKKLRRLVTCGVETDPASRAVKVRNLTPDFKVPHYVFLLSLLTQLELRQPP